MHRMLYGEHESIESFKYEYTSSLLSSEVVFADDSEITS